MYVHNNIWEVTCVVPKNEYNIYYFPLRVLNLIQASNSVWSISQFAKRVVNTTKILALQQTVYISLLSENYIIKWGRHYRNSSKYCIFAAKKAVLSLLNQSLFIRELSTLQRYKLLLNFEFGTRLKWGRRSSFLFYRPKNRRFLCKFAVLKTTFI